MRIREIAHSRTGDKGRLVTISLIAYREVDYPALVQFVTVERVSSCFREQNLRGVERYVIANLFALNFVLCRPPSESVTRSLALDAHGKSFGSLLLDMEFEPYA